MNDRAEMGIIIAMVIYGLAIMWVVSETVGSIDRMKNVENRITIIEDRVIMYSDPEYSGKLRALMMLDGSGQIPDRSLMSKEGYEAYIKWLSEKQNKDKYGHGS